MDEFINQEEKFDESRYISSLSDQLEQDYRRYAHTLDEEVIG